MNKDRYIFSQITDFITFYEFNKCVEKYRGNKRVCQLSCRDQFLSLMFGQPVDVARRWYARDNDFAIEIKNSVYALDSTIIDLCLATFKWAYFGLEKSAVKIHTQLDLKGNIPSL